MTLAFMGSDPISYEFLRPLLKEDDMEVRVIVTQPDRRLGRKMQQSAFRKLLVRDNVDIPILDPQNINFRPHEAGDPPAPAAALAAYGADLFVVVAYGQFIAKHVRDLPRFGCLNMHLSLLPEWRGAAPIQRAILSGATRTGVSAMRIARDMDAGDVYGQAEVPILPDDNHETLTARLVEAGIPLMLKTIRALGAGTAVATPQDHSRATEARKVVAEEWLLNWSEPAEDIGRRVRAFAPRPGCTGYLPPLNGPPPPEALVNPALLSRYSGPLLKILAVEILPDPAPDAATPGEIVAIRKDGIVVASGDHRCVRLASVRPDGKSTMDGAAFVNGYRSKLHVGDRLDPDPSVLLG